MAATKSFVRRALQGRRSGEKEMSLSVRENRKSRVECFRKMKPCSGALSASQGGS